MAAIYTHILIYAGMWFGTAYAARIKYGENLLKSNRTQACYWGREHCCCTVGENTLESVQCKKFVTGMIGGQEACKCGDSVVKENLGISGHAPKSWRKNAIAYQPSLLPTYMQGEGLTPFYNKMDDLCRLGSGAAITFTGDQPAGSCTNDRLFELAKSDEAEGKLECLDQLSASTQRNKDKLVSSKLMKTFDDRIDGSALMGCAKIGLGCNAGSLQSKAIVTAISNIKGMAGGVLKEKIMSKAQEMLRVETGLSEEVAKELLDWAFYHKEGDNPYCHPETLDDRREMLVRGLTAEEPGHVVKDEPWKYGDEVFKPIKVLLTETIDGMFAADCEKTEPPAATKDEAQNGKGVLMTLPDEQLQELESKKAAAVEEQQFLLAHDLKEQIRELTAGNRLAKYVEQIPMIKTTLEYLERPVLQHRIEANEARFVRLCMNTLADLLSNEKFFHQLTARDGKPLDGRGDNWKMPPELDGLWKMTREAKYFQRIWPDSLIGQFKNQSTMKPTCDCKDISPALGMHFLHMLPKIGLDFGNNVRITGSDRTLRSDKETETLKHVDVAGFGNTMIMVEAGISDPVFAAKYITKVLLAYGEKGGSASGLPDVSASGKIKGVLVGMPILQNLWSALQQELSPEVFAKKMKWFFVANIAWAVWHAIETPLPPEDVVLGLLTLAYSTLSSFAYDGEYLVFTNSKEFTDQMLAVYTVWNYRFVQQWASNGKPEDQWMHVSVALSMPIIESLVNHDDISYYINYRRDDLFHAMLLMLQQQQ